MPRDLKHVASVSNMAIAGSKVVCDSHDAPKGSYIESKVIGQSTYLRQDNGVYVFDLWAMPNTQAFQRQGV